MTEAMFKNDLTSLLEEGDVSSLIVFLQREARFDFLKKEGLIFYCVTTRNDEKDFLYQLVASSFIEYASKAGAQETYDSIVNFLNCQEIPGYFVLAINGITMDAKKNIDKNKKIHLISAKDIPDSCQKANYIPEYIDKNFIFPYGERPLESLMRMNHSTVLVTNDGKVKPTAALIYPFPIPKQESFSTDRIGEIRDKLLAICSYLTLIGPSSPNPLSFWWQPEPWLHCWPHSSGAWTEENFDIINAMATPCIINDSALQLCHDFLSLPKNFRERFLTPLNRLNYAILRKNIVDKAIELGIAVESLFINDDQKNELAYKLSIRAAFLLDNGNRAELFSLFKKLYDYRSSAVHGALLKNLPEVRIDLEKGIAHTADAIKKLIKYSSKKHENTINLKKFWEDFWKDLILGSVKNEAEVSSMILE